MSEPEHPAIGGKENVDIAGADWNFARFLPDSDAPQDRARVWRLGGGGEPLTVGREGHSVNGCLVFAQNVRLLPTRGFPHDHRLVAAAGGEPLGVRREGDRVDPARVIRERGDALAPREVPDEHLRIFAHRDEQTTVRREDCAPRGCRMSVAQARILPLVSDREVGRDERRRGGEHERERARLQQPPAQAPPEQSPCARAHFRVGVPLDEPQPAERDARPPVRRVVNEILPELAVGALRRVEHPARDQVDALDQVLVHQLVAPRVVLLKLSHEPRLDQKPDQARDRRVRALRAARNLAEGQREARVLVGDQTTQQQQRRAFVARRADHVFEEAMHELLFTARSHVGLRRVDAPALQLRADDLQLRRQDAVAPRQVARHLAAELHAERQSGIERRLRDDLRRLLLVEATQVVTLVAHQRLRNAPVELRADEVEEIRAQGEEEFDRQIARAVAVGDERRERGARAPRPEVDEELLELVADDDDLASERVGHAPQVSDRLFCLTRPDPSLLPTFFQEHDQRVFV